MDIRQMKLALTVDLMNLPDSQNPVSFAREKMNRFSSETGTYQGFSETSKSQISEDMGWKTLELKFEHCTLNIDLIEDKKKNEEYIQNFNLLEN